MHSPAPSPTIAAPSKLFLFGEYAVLAGARALVQATPRSVVATHHPDQRAYQVRGADLSASLALPRAVLSALGRPADDPAIQQLTLDVSALYEGGQKLGLGSSAASTVAIVKALAPHLSPAQTFETAHRAHRALQGGRGSGADVAASAFGGTLAYRLTASQLPSVGEHMGESLLKRNGEEVIADAAILSNLHLPTELRLVAVWTGAPASSVSFIKGLRAAYQKDARPIATTLRAIARQAEHAIDACLNDDAALWLDALHHGDEAMERLGDQCDLPIITAAHRDLRSRARDLGAVAKPSGAGGGDFSLVAWNASKDAPSELFDRAITLELA